jgi:hypothetical protein
LNITAATDSDGGDENRRKELNYFFLYSNQVSSVSIVSGYGLDDQAFEVQFQAEAKGFFL